MSTRWDGSWRRRLDQELVRCASLDAEQRPAVRRALATDPVAFALVYMTEHIRDKTTKQITFAECHYEWARMGLSWAKKGRSKPSPASDRHAVIAPRETGKSTWWYLILPLWAAAYGHKKFVGAFAHATHQAEGHLSTFKNELERNALLRADFPALCNPARRQSGGQVADRAGMIHTQNGFTFAGKGIDSTSLGMKVGHTRPDLIILDDIEPDESSYSGDLVAKRLRTVLDAILPMNIYATVIIVGTVQIPSSIIHQFVMYSKGETYEGMEWIGENQFKPHWHKALVINDDGTYRSLWPEKWPLEYLLKIQNTRSYLKNYENDPPDSDGSWWRREDLVYGSRPRDEYDRVVLLVDGAVTRKNQSDYTGLSVVGLDVKERRFYVREATEVRLVGEELRAKCLELIRDFDVSYVLVESNQGGDLWYTVFHDMPVKVSTFTQSERKEVRLRRLLGAYQREGQPVMHEKKLPALERRILAYPHTDHDDILDATAAAVEHLTWILLGRLGKVATAGTVRQYAYTGATTPGRAPTVARRKARR